MKNLFHTRRQAEVGTGRLDESPVGGGGNAAGQRSWKRQRWRRNPFLKHIVTTSRDPSPPPLHCSSPCLFNGAELRLNCAPTTDMTDAHSARLAWGFCTTAVVLLFHPEVQSLLDESPPPPPSPQLKLIPIGAALCNSRSGLRPKPVLLSVLDQQHDPRKKKKSRGGERALRRRVGRAV